MIHLFLFAWNKNHTRHDPIAAVPNPEQASALTQRRAGRPTSGNFALLTLLGSVACACCMATFSPAANAAGNYDPNFIPTPADYLYVDLNRTVNGTGLTPSDPTNLLPEEIGDGKQLFFNSDSGVQTIPCQEEAIIVNGNNIQVSSYGSKRATISAYQIFTTGWTRVGTSNVWRRSYSGAPSVSGPVVGNMIDLTKTTESPSGNVLTWHNVEENNNRIGIFRSNPSALPVGKYAYDWGYKIMYVNVGTNPNGRKLGISCAGRFLTTLFNKDLIRSSPTNVAIHNLRITGFARVAINIAGDARNWHVHNNDFYGNGGMFHTAAKWYLGSGIQIGQNASAIEINNNTIVQTFDSPITVQHFNRTNAESISDVRIHHNVIDKWALAAVEMADFGSNNKFSRITIEDNVAINGGMGFSATGDTPQGNTDGIHVRGGSKSGQFSDLIVRRNKIDAYNANINISGNNFPNAIIIDAGNIQGAGYGIRNGRPLNAFIRGTNNKLCNNTTQISDTAVNSVYINNTLTTGPCL